MGELPLREVHGGLGLHNLAPDALALVLGGGQIALGLGETSLTGGQLRLSGTELAYGLASFRLYRLDLLVHALAPLS